jgi:hypothetical protein
MAKYYSGNDGSEELMARLGFTGVHNFELRYVDDGVPEIVATRALDKDELRLVLDFFKSLIDEGEGGIIGGFVRCDQCSLFDPCGCGHIEEHRGGQFLFGCAAA